VHFGSAVSDRDTPENELQKANERGWVNIGAIRFGMREL